jgi:hypothetical protein
MHARMCLHTFAHTCTPTHTHTYTHVHTNIHTLHTRTHTLAPSHRYRAQLRKAFFTNTPSIARIMAADKGIAIKGDDEQRRQLDGRR